VRGECKEVSAVVVAPGLVVVVVVVMVRGFEGEVGLWVCEAVEVCACCEEGEEVAFPCWRAECARKAARKLERKGRFVGIISIVCWISDSVARSSSPVTS